MITSKQHDGCQTVEMIGVHNLVSNLMPIHIVEVSFCSVHISSDFISYAFSEAMEWDKRANLSLNFIPTFAWVTSPKKLSFC